MKNIGLSEDQLVEKINVSDTDAAAVQNALTELVEEGCNIIFATSWGYMDTCEAMEMCIRDSWMKVFIRIGLVWLILRTNVFISTTMIR